MRRGPFRDRFREQSAQQRAIHLHHVGKIQIEHVADRFLHHRMVPADVENAVAAQKIEIRLVIYVVEISAFGPGIDLVEADDALGRNQRAVQMPLVQFVILAQARRNDLFQIKSHQREDSAIWESNANKGLDPHLLSSPCPGRGSREAAGEGWQTKKPQIQNGICGFRFAN